jgi:DNA (cytosine-5)-methyltransferase 1
MDEGQQMKVLDLFSGIGGFSLGLERAGMETVAFCEFDKNCQKVLKKHWPDTPIYNDVRTLNGTNLHKAVDVICGGFPCQDISFAGKGAGLAGERSGLWWEFHRLIKEIQPSWVIAENVSALRSRGLDEVLRSLFEIGYDAEWYCIPASAIGAPHRRDRIWIVAYPNASRRGKSYETLERESPKQSYSGCFQPSSSVSDSDQPRLERWLQDGIANSQGWEKSSDGCATKCGSQWRRGRNSEWTFEPSVGRVADGFSGRVDSIKQLGNAVVPQIPELIGRAIMEYK